MNTNDDILPIGELPEEQRENYRLIEASLQIGDHPTARTHMGQILDYYVQADREIPLEIEAAYGRLLVLENPGFLTGWLLPKVRSLLTRKSEKF